MSYLGLLASHQKLLGFGFSLALFSSFGQTFFIAVFGSEIRSEFGLTHGSFGGLYSLATLASGLTLIWAGGAIDRFPLRRYTRAVVFGLVGATALFALAREVVVLWLAIYCLRLFGQGLMGHTGMTTVSRLFHQNRGKALSIAALGFPVGEAVFPRAFVGIKEAIGWRPSWWLIAIALVIVLVPLVEWLLRGIAKATHELPHDDQMALGQSRSGKDNWTRDRVMRDPRFYMVLPSVLAPPFVVTGLFFHQTALVDAKGWTLELFTGTLAAFAATQLAASLLSGPLVDRFGASRIITFYLVPLGAALALLASGNHPAIALGFMLAAGLSGGAQGTVVGAYWVEAYGALHLGAIRSLAMACMVFSTAVAPVLLGWFIDNGVSLEQIALMCLGVVALSILLAAVGRRQDEAVLRSAYQGS